MNKTAIKNFAIWARNKLIADVSYDARLIGITEDGIAKPLPQSFGGTQFFDIGTAEPYSISGEAVRQRDKLIEVIQQKEKDTDYKTAYQYVIEEVAYTWFNRLIAIRFMEVNDYLPSHIRVLSSESGKLEPDLVTTPFDAELPFTAEGEAQIFQLKQDNKLDEVFRLLFLKQCAALGDCLPRLFEQVDDYMPLLLAISFTDKDGVVCHLVNDIPESDWQDAVQIVGWLYQYYNTEPKEQVFANLKKNIKISKENIPAATQLFTPDWIVRYMVENSLGRLWSEGHPDFDKSEWKYYLDEAPQEPQVAQQLAELRKGYAALTPEDIKCIDPCMGSGHILAYLFDVLMQIYRSAGYTDRDAAASIVEHNLYGLDIDDRAYQLAYFAVMMKARQYNRRILNGENTCHVYAIQESNSINRAHLKYFGAGMDDIEKNAAKMQLEGLLDTLTDAKEYGSILNVESYNWDLLRRFVAAEDTAGQISMDSVGVEDTAEQLNRLVDIGETMNRKYWVTCTNPPYMGISNIGGRLYDLIQDEYEAFKQDLYCVFIKRCGDYTRYKGFQSMITQQSFMFNSRFEQNRDYIIDNHTVVNMAYLGTRAFDDISGDKVRTCAFVMLHNRIVKYSAYYVDLQEYSSEIEKELEYREVCNKRRSGEIHSNLEVYVANLEQFRKLPGKTFSYWISARIIDTMALPIKISQYAETRHGLVNGNGELFMRLWPECNINITGILDKANDKNVKWFPYNKGGSFRRWYGNREYIVNWEHNGLEVRNYKEDGKLKSSNYNLDYNFKKNITWSDIKSGKFSARFTPEGALFDTSGPSLFIKDDKRMCTLIGLLNTKVAQKYLEVSCTGLHYTTGAVSSIPFISVEKNIDRIVPVAIQKEKLDWDSFEMSWDFKKHPLLRNVSTISGAFAQWQSECDDRFNHLKVNEEELNRIFIDIYGLQDELTPEVEDKDVTVRKADLQRDIKSLLSYAVGCMFGRYSLDVEGLAYAGGEWDSSKYQSYIPDADNVIPITDEEYLDDDIVSRLCAWLKAVYGADTLEVNLDYIAKALGNKGSTSREIIRNYFLNDFFKDHCQTYSVTGSGKRPIYWLFDSGKQNGFKALVYLHRYTPDTIGNLRIDYLHKMQRVYESEINRMQDMMDHSNNAREVAAASKRKDKLAKQLKECREYDEKISHLALSRIELDLDDGVKVNYRKLQTAQDGKFYEVLADSKNIMVKEKK